MMDTVNNTALSATGASGPVTPSTPPRPAVLRHLEPAAVRITCEAGVLCVTVSGEPPYRKARILRMAPLTSPERYFSLRDETDWEIGVLRGLEGLDDDSRRLAEAEIARRYVLPRILRIRRSRERFEIVEWEVETDRGRRRVLTRDLRQSLLEPTPGRCILTDVDGNRYDVPDISVLDEHSRSLLLEHL